jgi:hypothetical protein
MTSAITAAVIVGGAAIYAGSQASSATKSAANTAASEQQNALTQQEALAAPYTSLGKSAIPKLQTLLGLTGGGAGGTPNNAAAETALAGTPGYQFTLNQGLDATKNAASASGMLLSGNTLQSLDKYGSGLADQTYQQTVGNLENAVNTGQAAAAGQAANVGTAATNMGNIAVNQGNTLAGIDANTIAGIENAGSTGVNNYIMNNTLASLTAGGGGSSLSDPALQGQYNSFNSSLGYNTGP